MQCAGTFVHPWLEARLNDCCAPCVGNHTQCRAPTTLKDATCDHEVCTGIFLVCRYACAKQKPTALNVHARSQTGLGTTGVKRCCGDWPAVLGNARRGRIHKHLATHADATPTARNALWRSACRQYLPLRECGLSALRRRSLMQWRHFGQSCSRKRVTI